MVAGAALVPVTSEVKEAMKALTGDLVTLRGQVFRKVEYQVEGKTEVFLAPVDVEAHINPLGLLLGTAGAGLAVLLGVVAWHGVSLPGPFGPIGLFLGLKDTTMGKDLSRGYERWMVKRRIRASGGEVVEARTGLTADEIQDALLESIGDTECQLLNREWQAAHRRGDKENADRFLQQARDGGCPWTKGR